MAQATGTSGADQATANPAALLFAGANNGGPRPGTVKLGPWPQFPTKKMPRRPTAAIRGNEGPLGGGGATQLGAAGSLTPEPRGNMVDAPRACPRTCDRHMCAHMPSARN